jgi:aspartate racemase
LVKRAGILGGIGPQSTVEYYRGIIHAYRERTKDGSYPQVLINSIDMTRMLSLVAADRLEELAAFLSAELAVLADAGVDFAALAANTPHIVFGELVRRLRIPLVSIVDAACSAAVERGYRRSGLFGTKFTMQARFYRDVFAAAGIAVVAPPASEQALIHDIYHDELLNGIFRDESAARLHGVVARMRREERIDCVVLAGTELPLLLPQPAYEGVPVVDTTKEHVKRIVETLLA